jgi:DNA-binding SARP family transcriptional activator
MMVKRWRIELFDGLRARLLDERGGRTVAEFESRKVASLLAYLAFYRERRHLREMLAEGLWPEERVEATRERFRHALSQLRHLLEPEKVPPGSVLVADRVQVHLRPEVCGTDVAEFEAALRAAASADLAGRVRHLQRAIELYRGELLPGFYEEWVLSERARLAQAYCDALSQAATALAAAGDLAAAIACGRRAVAADPLAEDAHRQLMALYQAAGRAPEALRHYRELERILHHELGSVPCEATRALHDQIAAVARTMATPIQRGGREDGAVARNVSGGAARPPHRHASPLLRSHPSLEPEGGAVPLESPFYLERPVDAEFLAALARGDSTVLIKGARQIGKTSLLARGLDQARQAGARVISTDLQKYTADQLATADSLFLTVATEMADQLDLDVAPEAPWNLQRGWNVNFERFLRRQVLGRLESPIVWGLDEADRLFGHPFSGEVFGLFRSWHNQRSIDPEGPWSRLTLAIAYATEAHLFITDLNQSPFNVGTRLTLEDFTLGEVAEMNRRYHSPLQEIDEVRRFCRLIGGHPYLARRGLHAMVAEGLDLTALEAQAEGAEGVFADHLRRMLAALRRDAGLCDAVRAILQGKPCPSADAFYRLRSAGVVAGRFAQDARLRCRLYQRCLERYLQ